MISLRLFSVIALILLFPTARAFSQANLLPDPSLEEPKEKDRFGRVFKYWGGWIYEGECEFRVSSIARTGKTSLLIVGGHQPKIRAFPEPRPKLAPGRYRVTAYLRGLDIGLGKYNQTTELMFDGKYMQLKKNGTFGWTKLTYVADVKEAKVNAHPSFGLMAPGYLWVDDISLEKVGLDVPLTPQPVFGREESPIAPPSKVPAAAVRCPQCGYRNALSWGDCYACGAELAKKRRESGPAIKSITSFEEKNPFSGSAKVVGEHASNGSRAMRIDRGYASMESQQNWSGYDYVKADVYTDARSPLELNIEIRDKGTRDYWTRVNYNTVIPPGKSTLIIPTALYVGEKSRPGRPLQLHAITRLVFAIGAKPDAPLYIDNIRLERDTETEKAHFDGLWAFDLGPPSSPVMEGFTPLDVGKPYSKGRGFGWKDVKFWRVFDALQPDPLYRDFICVEKGGLAIDLPNGKYHVMVNMDSPSGYWGEFQRYRKRALVVEGVRHGDSLDLESFKRKYYRFWDHEDLPGDNTFDRYQRPYFQEKLVEAVVRDGQLNIEFDGLDWACCVSAIVVFPQANLSEGRRFLQFVQDRRRFHFDNTFKRVLPPKTGDRKSATTADERQGFIPFTRDWMKDVQYSDRPLDGERATKLIGSAFAGEMEPIALSLAPLTDLGNVTLRVGDLTGPGGAAVPSTSIDVGHVQYRLRRLNEEGSVYTIAPRLLIPRATAPVPKDVTRTFWLTVKVPAEAKPGVYSGEVKLSVEKGGVLSLPLTFHVRKGTLDAVDIPAGPWGFTIDLPWYPEEVAGWNHAMADKSLKKLRAYGFTTTSGIPMRMLGSRNGVPRFDFSRADAQMKLLRANGFTMPVVNYAPFDGMNVYYKDQNRMKEAGYKDYSAFIRAAFTGIQDHAEENDWLPVYWNLADEPIGDDLKRSAENAEAYRKAFPKGPPYFTGASSFKGTDTKDPHYRLSKALHVANWNTHDADSVRLIQKAGGDWAFYNGGNRWTYGFYMYKAAKEYDMKFRVAWHWNNVAGDPYYALDSREDDFAWCNSSPTGELIPSIQFDRLREGIDDYRRLVTLARLAEERKGAAAADEGQRVIRDILASFRLGQRELTGAASFTELRERVDEAIEWLRNP